MLAKYNDTSLLLGNELEGGVFFDFSVLPVSPLPLPPEPSPSSSSMPADPSVSPLSPPLPPGERRLLVCL